MHIKELLGTKYYVPRVHGRRGSTHNARLIKKQLQDYIDKNPEEKLWILAHSKGGIDSLHFLRRNAEFASKYIVGVSTIASPIMGSPHTDHLLVKFLQMVIKLENTTLYQKIDRGRDYLLKNVPRYLSENFQKKWFDRNSKNLPRTSFIHPWPSKANGTNPISGCCLRSFYLKMKCQMMELSVSIGPISPHLFHIPIWEFSRAIILLGQGPQLLIKRP